MANASFLRARSYELIQLQQLPLPDLRPAQKESIPHVFRCMAEKVHAGDMASSGGKKDAEAATHHPVMAMQTEHFPEITAAPELSSDLLDEFGHQLADVMGVIEVLIENRFNAFLCCCRHSMHAVHQDAPFCREWQSTCIDK